MMKKLFLIMALLVAFNAHAQRYDTLINKNGSVVFCEKFKEGGDYVVKLYSNPSHYSQVIEMAKVIISTDGKVDVQKWSIYEKWKKYKIPKTYRIYDTYFPGYWLFLNLDYNVYIRKTDDYVTIGGQYDYFKEPSNAKEIIISLNDIEKTWNEVKPLQGQEFVYENFKAVVNKDGNFEIYFDDKPAFVARMNGEFFLSVSYDFYQKYDFYKQMYNLKISNNCVRWSSEEKDMLAIFSYDKLVLYEGKEVNRKKEVLKEFVVL